MLYHLQQLFCVANILLNTGLQYRLFCTVMFFVTIVISIVVVCMQCPPCKVFTPSLIGVYQTLLSEHLNFEVVYVGSDRSVESFREYFSSMPWLAIPFGDARIDKLTNHFNVKGTCSMLDVKLLQTVQVFDSSVDSTLLQTTPHFKLQPVAALFCQCCLPSSCIHAIV